MSIVALTAAVLRSVPGGKFIAILSDDRKPTDVVLEQEAYRGPDVRERLHRDEHRVLSPQHFSYLCHEILPRTSLPCSRQRNTRKNNPNTRLAKGVSLRRRHWSAALRITSACVG